MAARGGRGQGWGQDQGQDQGRGLDQGQDQARTTMLRGCSRVRSSSWMSG